MTRRKSPDETEQRYSTALVRCRQVAEEMKARLPGVPVATPEEALSGLTLRAAARHEAGHILATAVAGDWPFAASLYVVPIPPHLEGVAAVRTSSSRNTALFAVAGAVAQGVPWIGPADAVLFEKTTTPGLALQHYQRARQRAERIFEAHSNALQHLTRRLASRGTLFRPQILQILLLRGIACRRMPAFVSREYRTEVQPMLREMNRLFPLAKESKR